MRIVDMHAHIFPDKIAQAASVAIGDFYDMPMRFDGKVSTLLELGRRYGIDTHVVHSVATVPQQVRAVNDFIAQTVKQYPGRFVGFATIHPDFEPIAEEIDRIISLGLKGIKLHPDFQRFLIDDPKAFQIYEAVGDRLPVLMHCGDFRFEYSKAIRIVSVLDKFPKLNMICAHFGGWSEWDEAASVLAGRRVMVDTSSSLYALDPEKARKLINQFGPRNVFFGTDYPMWGPENELEWMERIELTPEEREFIMHGNSERLLNI